MKYVIFTLQDQSFAVNVDQVISIERLQEITMIPRTSAFIKGVTVIRGVTTPIIDLKERLWVDETAQTDDTRILVVHIQGMQIGFIIDAATAVMDIDEAVIEPAPQIATGTGETFIKSVANLEDGLLMILDLNTMVNPLEKQELEEVAAK
ncbi:purine-binding chemotaxis protein CheW [Oceanobacillus piezotolerans]|uniref:Purine-binding chemotaxis protein CheW n=1 Tax=Oceanobacillus piezotolerans TaxID=2448030 RepID=A0A498D8H2_9BACI|nr:chemotaxis protein CheW [Oceanobacillus piezotolerans]RLL46683.1 purine-binding chemotaxis protein CheW [Oceanobacillus piezotolerans]